MHLNWKRFIWVIFVLLYTALFFYNCLKSSNNWLMPYIFTMILIIWLGIEYYQKHLFFQSGLIKFELYSLPLRLLFALFFYSAFIIGISTTIWWPTNQIGFYPFIRIIGLLILLYSIFLRWQTNVTKSVTTHVISKFYLSIALLSFSLALGYGSYLLLFYTVFGFLLIFLQYKYELRIFKDFENFAYHNQKPLKFERKDYENQWHRYCEQRLKKTRNE